MSAREWLEADHPSLLQYQTTLTVAAVASGGVAFDEFGSFSAVQFAQFLFAILLSLVSVAFLAVTSPATATSVGLGDNDEKD